MTSMMAIRSKPSMLQFSPFNEGRPLSTHYKPLTSCFKTRDLLKNSTRDDKKSTFNPEWGVIGSGLTGVRKGIQTSSDTSASNQVQVWSLTVPVTNDPIAIKYLSQRDSRFKLPEIEHHGDMSNLRPDDREMDTVMRLRWLYMSTASRDRKYLSDILDAHTDALCSKSYLSLSTLDKNWILYEAMIPKPSVGPEVVRKLTRRHSLSGPLGLPKGNFRKRAKRSLPLTGCYQDAARSKKYIPGVTMGLGYIDLSNTLTEGFVTMFESDMEESDVEEEAIVEESDVEEDASEEEDAVVEEAAGRGNVKRTHVWDFT